MVTSDYCTAKLLHSINFTCAKTYMNSLMYLT